MVGVTTRGKVHRAPPCIVERASYVCISLFTRPNLGLKAFSVMACGPKLGLHMSSSALEPIFLPGRSGGQHLYKAPLSLDLYAPEKE